MGDYKFVRSYDFQSHVTFDEYIDNGTGCFHYDVLVSDEDEGMGFDTTGQLSENLLKDMARIAEHAAMLYRVYGYNSAQRDMRKALGL